MRLYGFNHSEEDTVKRNLGLLKPNEASCLWCTEVFDAELENNETFCSTECDRFWEAHVEKINRAIAELVEEE